MVSHMSCRLGACGGLPNSVMSAPAMKVRPSQISTMALTAALPNACCMPLMMPSRTCCDSAFTGGELTVSTAISPSTARSVTALIAAIGTSPSRKRSARKLENAVCSAGGHYRLGLARPGGVEGSRLAAVGFGIRGARVRRAVFLPEGSQAGGADDLFEPRVMPQKRRLGHPQHPQRHGLPLALQAGHAIEDEFRAAQRGATEDFRRCVDTSLARRARDRLQRIRNARAIRRCLQQRLGPLAKLLVAR